MEADEQETYHRTAPKGIDRLFLSLATVYGKSWFDKWQGVDMEAMKSTWTRSLSGLNGQQIRDALDYCADYEPFVPTLPRFREVCDQMRKTDTVKALPRKFTSEEQERNRERMKEAMSKLTGSVGNKQWARKILKRAEDGDRSVADIAIRFAREALAA